MTTSEEDRQIGLARALQEFDQLLAKRDDDQPADINELAGLSVYTKIDQP